MKKTSFVIYRTEAKTICETIETAMLYDTYRKAIKKANGQSLPTGTTKITIKKQFFGLRTTFRIRNFASDLV